MKEVYVKVKQILIGFAAFGAACGVVAPAHAELRCTVTDPTGTPLNVREANKNIIGKLENGAIVIPKLNGTDPSGKAWVFVAEPGGKDIGWVYREFVTCH
jgi:hypothetical protein